MNKTKGIHHPKTCFRRNDKGSSSIWGAIITGKTEFAGTESSKYMSKYVRLFFSLLNSLKYIYVFKAKVTTLSGEISKYADIIHTTT